MKKIVYLSLVLYLIFSCVQPNIVSNLSNGNDNSGKYGSITIFTKDNKNKALYIDTLRSIIIPEIKYATITVSGNGFSDISKTVVVTDGAGSGVTIDNIPVGKNRVISVQARTDTDNMSGIVMRNISDINTGNNSVTVNWNSTPLGDVFYKLLKEYSYSIITMPDATKTNITNVINGTTVAHKSLINTTNIATDVKNNTLKSANDASYKITTTDATFSINNVSVFTGFTAQINDPSSAKKGSITATNTITGIKPGNWELIISLDNGVIYRSGVKTIGESTYNFGALDLGVAKPVFSPAESTFTGSVSVTLSTSTAGAEIYYTTDGSEPTKLSTKYTVAISVSDTTTLKAKAFKTDFVDSDVVTKTYTKQISASLGDNHPASGSYSQVDQGSWASASYALGAHFVGGAGTDATFAVYSKNATKILLEIYDDKTGSNAKYDYWMAKNSSDNIWRAKLKTVPNGTFYAFRVWGPNWTYDASWARGNSDKGFVNDVDTNGNRFNPNKVLFDTYAKEISHDKENPTMTLAGENGGMYGTGGTDTSSDHKYSGPSTGGTPINRRNVDTGKWAPKSVLVYDTTSFGTKPNIAQKDAIIYEAHVRGLTKHPSTANLTTILSGIGGFGSVVNIPENERGTYKGAGKMAKYLKALGFNTIEFLPVHETANDTNPDNSPGGNYWGYMTYGFFAPDRRYSSDKSPGGPTKEFKDMVKAFHDEGIEVYLDVVYNHSGEGGIWDATGKCAELTFMRGFDNAEYYALVDSDKSKYWETSGCGNNLYTNNPPIKQFVLDSLTYWIDKMGVDGFRFDLAPILGRNGPPNYPYDSSNGTITAIASLGATKNVEMIAEAWDCQWPGGYQVSNFPSGWGEWNGIYRDVVRKFVKGSGNKTSGYPSFTDVFHGSYGPLDRSSGNTHTGFNDNGGPHKSVNFIIAHDGFTLMDLVSYAGKNNNVTWPFGPSDGGADDNDSWDSGGDHALRRQQLRNLWTIQFFSRGVPMTVWGDEFGRTQNGNNNPYNIDSVATWSNYNMINTDSPTAISTDGGGSYHNNFGTDGKADSKNNLFLFVKELTKIRNNHVALRQADYSMTITYKKEDGTTNLTDSDKCVWIRLDGSSKGDSDFLLFINAFTSTVNFTIPTPDSGKKWARIIDTSNWAETSDNIWDLDSAAILDPASYGVNAHSVVVFQEVESVATPTIKPTQDFVGGTFNITATCATGGATIRYTTDGTDPTISSTTFPGGVDITATTTFKARAFKSGMVASPIASATYTNTASVEKPVLSMGSTKFWKSATIFAKSNTSGASLTYTLDGSEPTSGSTSFPSTGVDITSTKTLKVKGFKSGLSDSEVTSATYTIQSDGSYTESAYGVMLQGFGWDSASDSKTWYTTISGKKDDIKNRFEYVWLPPPSKTPSFSKQGYIPTDLNDLNSYYGTEAELKAAISDISPAKAIADVVINHRGGSVGWGKFENPFWDEDYKAICSDDEGFTDVASDMYGWGGSKGAADSGDGYSAARDLDHTNANVVKGIKTWMNSRLKDVGFVGWRYDYVKGFNGSYVGGYNSATKNSTGAFFSVGEHWPTSGFNPSDTSSWASTINGWVTATNSGGTRSRVFDFVLKGNLNYAFGYQVGDPITEDKRSEWNMSRLADGNNIFRSNPADAVTFVDNHDTGSAQHHWELDPFDLGPAYTFILTHPGFPSVLWDHYFNITNVPGTSNTLKQHIEYLIDLRKTTVKIKYNSSITVLASTTTNYAAKITGDSGEIVVKIGGDMWSPSGAGYDGNYPIYSGTNFAIWQKDVNPPTIKLKMTVDVGGGNSVFFTGSFTEGDGWSKVVKGSWTTGNVWECEINTPSGSFTWKTLKGASSKNTGDLISGGGFTWEGDPNHDQTNLHPSFNGGF